MAQPFRCLWEQMSPEAQAAAEQKMQAMLAAMPLQELQQAQQPAQAPAGHAPQAPQTTELTFRTPWMALHVFSRGIFRTPSKPQPWYVVIA